ncbi:beta-mannosidase [Nocardia sp. NPDC049149]|uniref:beta-mannosidase n=1 Tax=Nocardia sp. NPDC049149 TaxID=3364315 RepID=UPI00371A2C48
MTQVRFAAVWTAALLVTGLCACADDAKAPPSTPSADAVVSASPTGLRLRDKQWWPVGFNAPQLATNWSVNFGCGAQTDLDRYFGALPRNSLTRFNLFQALAVNKETGAMDYSPADAVFAAAAKHDQLVLPVLSPQDGGCADEQFKQRQWYVDGWKIVTPIHGRAVLSFQEWVRTAVARWRHVPVLAGWELVGEPEPSNCTGGHCDLPARTCPADAAQVLRTFMDDAGAIVRALDPQRLIFAGYAGGGQCGTQGDEFRYVSESPQVDVVEYHDYSTTDSSLPGDQWNGLAVRLQQAAALRKPLLVAEIGEKAGSCGSVATRRAHLDAELVAQRNAGSAGALFWAFVPDPRPDQCTFDIGPDDPLWSLVAERTTVG